MITSSPRGNPKLLQIGLLTLVIGSAWLLRETQGTLLMEMYHALNHPWQVLHGGGNIDRRIQDARLWELQTRITDLETQNQKLQDLLGYIEKKPPTSKPIPARVIGRSADHWWQQVTINRGYNAGITEGSIVKSDGGLVGLVETVTPNTSRVMLISDIRSKVGVSISRTSAHGILRGDSSVEAVLEFYEKVPNVKVGDLVSTSTYSQRFPTGIPVGRIKSLHLNKPPVSVARVELFPPILSLDWVAVYPKPLRSED